MTDIHKIKDLGLQNTLLKFQSCCLKFHGSTLPSIFVEVWQNYRKMFETFLIKNSVLQRLNHQEKIALCVWSCQRGSKER